MTIPFLRGKSIVGTVEEPLSARTFIEPPPEPLPEEVIPSSRPAAPSNEDLGQMMLNSNKATNYMVRNMQTIANRVAAQEEIVSELRAIRKYMGWVWSLVIWGIPVIGGSGLLALYNWLGLHFHWK